MRALTKFLRAGACAGLLAACVAAIPPAWAQGAAPPSADGMALPSAPPSAPVPAPSPALSLTPATSRLPPGQHTLTVSHGGERRTVIVQVPRAGDGAPRPLVLALHGGGGHAAHMAEDDRYRLAAMAEREGMVVAFVNGHSRWPGGRFATWNAGGCCGDARDKGIDDVGVLRAVVADLATRTPLDRGRVFATGMSNGGMMAHRLACDAADLVAAVAPVAGTDATADCRPTHPVAVLHVHARDDRHVQYGGGAGPDSVRDRAKVMDYVSVDETMARWVRRDRCTAAPVTTRETPGVACVTWSGCEGGVTVQRCAVEDGGHSWPGGAPGRLGKGETSRAYDASLEIGRFFREAPPRR